MKNKNQDKKPHESIIGKIIYGFLLFMPLLAIGVTCSYAIFNKNAYQSYYGETINEENFITIDKNKLTSENTYYFISNPIAQTETTSVTIYVNDLTRNNQSLPTCNNIRFVYQNNVNYIFYYNDGTYLGENNLNTSSINVKFDFVYSTQIINLNSVYNKFYYLEYKELSFVSEVFYYSIDKVQQSPLFNWAEKSAIYTGMTTTCNALNITTPFIPLLMTYWLIISVIYILYDIILVILHIFHKKIHQLEDSF